MRAELFEAMLATCPAERRELARQIYHRFAEGDSTEFFTQLFLLLDVYAHYSERIPQMCLEANQSAVTNLQKFREELALLAQMMNQRGLNMSNQVERTGELCLKTQAKCDETTARLEALVKNLGAGVDTQAIVQGIQAALQSGVQAKIFAPFIAQTEALTKQVAPTLAAIERANDRAARLWPRRIWSVALASGLLFGLALGLCGTAWAYHKFQDNYERNVAEKITAAERLIHDNQAAFRLLAIAQVPIRVMSLENPDATNSARFGLVIPDVEDARTRPNHGANQGCIIFSRPLSEVQQRQMQKELQ